MVLLQTEEGKFALCNNCGMSSADYNTCEGCHKEMPDEPKYTFTDKYDSAKKVSFMMWNIILKVLIKQFDTLVKSSKQGIRNILGKTKSLSLS